MCGCHLIGGFDYSKQPTLSPLYLFQATKPWFWKTCFSTDANPGDVNSRRLEGRTAAVKIGATKVDARIEYAINYIALRIVKPVNALLKLFCACLVATARDDTVNIQLWRLASLLTRHELIARSFSPVSCL